MKKRRKKKREGKKVCIYTGPESFIRERKKREREKKKERRQKNLYLHRAGIEIHAAAL